MPFTLRHPLISQRLDAELHEDSIGTYATIRGGGRFQMLFPGRLDKLVRATVRHRTRIDVPNVSVPEPAGGIDDPGGGRPPHNPFPDPLHNGVVVNEEGIGCTLTIYDPKGKPFTADIVTVNDLKRYRDPRGVPMGEWTFDIEGQSKIYHPNPALNETVYEPEGHIELSLFETIESESAAPLVPSTPLDGSRQDFDFDLLRVGVFIATITANAAESEWHGSMQLIDPDGNRLAWSTSRELRVDLPLGLLGRSRDNEGKPRLWTLAIAPQGGVVVGSPRVTATVIASARINTNILHERLARLIGPEGNFIELFGKNEAGQAKAQLVINDIAAAETIEMHGLLSSRLRKEMQSTDIVAGQPMTLYSHDEDFDYGLTLDASDISLDTVSLTVGPGEALGAETPVVRVAVTTNGAIRVRWEGKTIATAQVTDGRIVMEVGVRIDGDGIPRIVTWVPEKPFDIDLDGVVIAALVLALGGIIGGISAAAIDEYIEDIVNGRIREGAEDLFDDPTLAATIMMTLMGAHLSYLPVRFEGDDIVFDHVAPLEPDPKPRAGYSGAIGRMVMHESVTGPTFMPFSLGDTWAADNLKAKIDHVVVVMMENRSYDHVLGYRARPPFNDGANGLTDDILQAINVPGQYEARPLREAGFAPNALGLMTRIPKGVGHKLSDVKEQMSGTISGPGGRAINDPKFFVENFEHKLGSDPARWDGVVPQDVMGYYGQFDGENGDDLPFFSYLAEHYSYSDRYFCSHPGPTLPNRMYSLTGDVQYDRLGVPILDNNNSDNFLLSRAMTIYDMLSRHGLSWRVYESSPSATMLRMFARYATDEDNIRDIGQIETDLATGDLPAFSYVEPQMHSHPQDDDHPDADMYRGQKFLRRVYQALRSNPSVWERTMLIITYDEHGGLYDHVVPPIADVMGAELFHGQAIDGLAAIDIVSDGDGSPTGGGGGTGGGIGGLLGSRGLHIDPHVLELLAEDDAPDPVDIPHYIDVPYGVRVPTFVVSPWVPPGKGPSIVLDHCSILKTVLARFLGDQKPFIGNRVRPSLSFESFLTEAAPRMDVPEPPELGELPFTARMLVPGTSRIETEPLFRREMREGPVDYHRLSGRLARMLGR